MPDLLLELFSEEIPSRFQRKAAGDLKKLICDALVDNGLTYEGAKEYWTPRRLVLDLRGLSAKSSDIREEKKGPRTDAPEKAIEGFLRGAGLESIEKATVKNDPKKGDFYVAIVEKKGQKAENIIKQVMPDIIRNFPWPKSMRWGEASREAGALKWVRPLQSILCTFGPETEDSEILPFEVSDIKASNKTMGHRFLANKEITVKRFDDYAAQLEKAKVIIDPERRKEIILADAKNLAFAQGFELVEDPGLLEEVSGLIEYPTVLMGEFEEEYLDIPAEVIQLTIKENQKCFVLKKQGTNELVNRFLLVSNIIPSDGGKEVARGNGKVVRARLSDAKFFWESDLHQTAKEDGFDEWVAGLDQVTFHAKLGSQGERIKRIIALAKELAPIVGADAEKAKRAAYFAKADLQSAMVYEFPEVQGMIGRRYAEIAGEDASVSLAIEEHYKPLGPSDDVPSDPVSVAVALADKLDTLVGFWVIDEKPTGSKDPYALRRAALGVIRLVVENNVRFSMLEKVNNDLLSFFHDRLKVFLKDQGIRHEVIDAIITPESDDLLMIVQKAKALQKLVDSEDGENLIQGYKRAANILASEEKKNTKIADKVADDLFEFDEERALFNTLENVELLAGNAIKDEDLEEAMTRLSTLRAPIDAFFEKVHVNADDEKVRANRLALLDRIRSATQTIADFSKLNG